GLTLSPASDSGTPGDNITNVTKPVITGTGVVGDTITLFDGATQVGSATVGANGSWSVTTRTLSAGTNTLAAPQTDVAANVSAASTALALTMDTIIPSAPSGLTLSPATDSGP